MTTTNNIKEYIENKIKNIQKKYNFNPNIGAEQVELLDIHAKKAYIIFSEFLTMIKKCDLDIKITYDPHIKYKEDSKNLFLYFAQKGNSNIWKIGRSKTPIERTKQVETGNDGNLYFRYQVPINCPTIETKVKKYLQKRKTRDKNKSYKGEWFVLSAEEINDIIFRIKENKELLKLKRI